MKLSPLVQELIDSLRCLPGVGPKSAQRMAFHLLERNRIGGNKLAVVLDKAMEDVGYCQGCRTFTELELCDICASPKRQLKRIICVVESPADIIAIEQTGEFTGRYFVLMGHLSPLDNIGPDQLGIEQLIKLVDAGEVNEAILATNLTLEGQATGDFLLDLLQSRSINVTRLARGMPMGGELEYMDSGTLHQAFSDRRSV